MPKGHGVENHSDFAAEFPGENEHEREGENVHGLHSEHDGKLDENGSKQTDEAEDEENANELGALAGFLRRVVVSIFVAHDKKPHAGKHADETEHVAEVEAGGDLHERDAGDQPL